MTVWKENVEGTIFWNIYTAATIPLPASLKMWGFPEDEIVTEAKEFYALRSLNRMNKIPLKRLNSQPALLSVLLYIDNHFEHRNTSYLYSTQKRISKTGTIYIRRYVRQCLHNGERSSLETPLE